MNHPTKFHLSHNFRNQFSLKLSKFYQPFSCLLLMFLVLSQTLNAEATTTKPVLKRGSRGPEVTALQNQLKTMGYFTVEPTGFYGPVTQQAVQKLQRDQKLPADGIVGKKTWSVLETPKTSPQVSPPSQPVVKSTPQPLPQPETATVLPPINPSTPGYSLSKLPAPWQNQTLQTSFQAALSLLDNPEFIPPKNPGGKMTLKDTITGRISPKSIVHSGRGLFFAQNMMYSHTITVYNRQLELVKTISDTVNLSKFGQTQYSGNYQGAPVEAAFSPDGKYGYVSNYQMYGAGFRKPGNDRCSPQGKHDPSFLYRVNTETLEIDAVIPVGAVPKYAAVSPNGKWVLVTNWCTWDVSIIDAETNQEVKRIYLGRYPRGIAIDSASEKAYIAIMGSTEIAIVNLNNFSVDRLKNVGRSPRHLNLDPAGDYLYATLNSEGRIAKIDLSTGRVISKITTGNAPRSMAISDDGQFLYVVNYHSNSMSKVKTDEFKVVQTVKVNHHPIGITYDPLTRQVWVACYSGSILVFQD